MHTLLRNIVALLCVFAPGIATAQPYPSKPVRVLAGFPPGAGVDIATRLVAAKLSESFGRQFVVDNRPGAAGNIAVEMAARAAPDGYTLLAGTQAATIAQSAYSKVPFDLVKDFSPIALIAAAPFVLTIHPSIPAKSLQALIALAKAQPGQLSYATPGIGSGPHLAGELFKMQAGINILHIPYKGTVPATADVIGGNVAMAIANSLVSLPHMRSGRLRGIAITSPKRSPVAPELPTFTESGVPGLESGTWYSLLAPAGTPREIVTRLNAAVVQIVQLPDIREKLSAQGAEPLTGTPEQVAELIRSEIAKWAKVVKTSGIRLD